MGMKGNNFWNRNSCGAALVTQTVNDTSVNGATISKPWMRGSQITFIVNASAFPATTDVTIVFEVQELDGDWVALNQRDGTTQLAFPPTLYDDGGGGEGAVRIGTIPFELIDTDAYKAIRCVVANGAATAAIVGIAYVISDTLEDVTDQTDDLWALTRAA